MNSDFEWILEDSLRRLRSGQSAEECLAAYPDQAEDLRPLLRVADHLRVAPAPLPRAQAIQAGRERMLAAAKSSAARNSFVQPVSSGVLSRYTVRIFTFLKTLLFGKETYGMKFALRLAINLVVVLMIGGVLAVNASASSLPGDPLYSVKRTWEEVRLNLTLNDPARQQIQDQIQQLRLEEIREMIQMGKTGVVEFEGRLESIAAEKWVVSGFQVRMLPDTIVEGDPAVGQTIRVRAILLNNGALTALQTRVQMRSQQPEQPKQPTSSPMPLASRTPMPTSPTSMPSRAPWPTHEPTHTWEPTHEPAYEATHESTHTWEPTHEPTHVPQPTSGPTHQNQLDDNHQNQDNHNSDNDRQDQDNHQDNDSHNSTSDSGSRHSRP